MSPLNEVPQRPARWRSFEEWVRLAQLGVWLFVLALAVFAVQSVVLPAYPGRDMSRYLQTYFQLGYHVPVYPAVLNTRGPLAALGVGLPLEAGGWAAEIWLGLLYALSIVAWARIALSSDHAPRSSRAHSCSSFRVTESSSTSSRAIPLCCCVRGWALLYRGRFKAVRRAFPSSALGSGRSCCSSRQPGAAGHGLLPLVPSRALAGSLAWVAAVLIPAVALSQAWKASPSSVTASVRSSRAPDCWLSLPRGAVPASSPWRVGSARWSGRPRRGRARVRGLPGQSPGQYGRSVVQNESNQFVYRSFELDRIMAPENGPACATSWRASSSESCFRGSRIARTASTSTSSLRRAATASSAICQVSPHPADLAGATREAIRKHPGTFVSSIARTLWEQLASRPVYAPESSGAATARGASRPNQTEYIVVNGRRLPKPSEGQPIPSSAIGPLLWTPGGPAQEVWTSPTEHRFVFSDPRDARRYEKLGEDVGRLSNRLPTRDGAPSVTHRLNQVSHRFPPLIAFLLIGVISLAWRRPRGALVVIAPAVAGLVVIAATALVAPSVAEYAAPVSPAFVLLTAVGLTGAPARGRKTMRLESWRPVAGLIVGAAAAIWAAKLYIERLKDFVDGAGAPNDLSIFLHAAGKVLHAASPYAYEADKTFAYPPFAAWLVAPLHPLSGSAAGFVWTLLSLAMVALALWLLELRDWRCYALAFVFLFTRSSIDLGTIEPPLLLAVAAGWRWRDRPFHTALAIGTAIVLKLFLWPLALWLAVTRRLRAAAAAVVFALALALVSWAAIGFAGIGDYPGLLRHLANDESTSSYSVVALGVRAHMPLVAARVVAVLVALALLAAAAWVARDERRAARDRDVATLTLTLAAALAASPIVWVHYFLLLLVPLALTRPRLSLLWFVPFAFQPVGEAAWPAGDARNLGLALVATLVILGAGVVHADWRPALRRNPPLRLPSWSRIRSGT